MLAPNLPQITSLISVTANGSINCRKVEQLFLLLGFSSSYKLH